MEYYGRPPNFPAKVGLLAEDRSDNEILAKDVGLETATAMIEIAS